MNRCAVVSFYNTPSGMFPWWDQFPNLITSKLSTLNIDHILFYREFTENSLHAKNQQRLATNTELNSWKWLLLHLLPLCRQYEKVIIHTHSHYPPIKVWLLTHLLPRCEWHITEHRIASNTISRNKQRLKIILRKFNLLPKHVIGVSNAVKDKSSISYGPTNVKTIYNGIDLSQYTSSQDLSKPLTEPIKFLYIGRLDKKKGVIELIEAFKLLKQNKSTALLTIVGGGSLLQELKTICNESGLNKTITFAGHQPNVRPYYETHQAVIVPTQIEEALSLVAIEAKAMGLPVIYANKGGLPEVFSESDSGIMLESPSPIEISNAVSRLTNDLNFYQTLASKAKSDISRFDIEVMIEQYINHYQQSFSCMD